MKNRVLSLIVAIICACALHGSTRITATLQITSTPLDGDSIQVNSSTIRYWTTTVVDPSTNIVIGADIGECATNLLSHAGAYPWGAGILTRQTASDTLEIVALPDQSLTVTLGGSWASLSYSTQTVASAKSMPVPLSAIPTLTERTNIASQVVSDLETYSDTAFSTGTTLLSNFLDLSSAQTVTGAKTFAASSQVWNGGRITNTWLDFVIIDYRSGSISGVHFYDELGNRSVAIAPDVYGVPSLYDIYAYPEVGEGGIPLDWTPSDENILNVKAADKRYGQLASDNTWAGTNTFTQITNSTIVGSVISSAVSISGDIDNLANGTIDSAAIVNADITSATEISGAVGTLTDGYWTNAILSDATITNVTVRESTSFVGIDYTSLATGDNAAVDFGAATYIRITSGPTGDFTIHGIAGGYDGRVLVIQNSVPYDMILANESGGDPTPANRIITQTGYDASFTDEATIVLVYDGTQSRWILAAISEPQSRAYAELYEVNAYGSTITVSTAGQWYQWTTAIVGQGTGPSLAQGYSATDEIIIGDAGSGAYLVTVSASVGGTPGSTVSMTVFQDSYAMTQISAEATLDASGNSTSLFASGILSLSTGASVTLRFSSDGSGNVVYVYRANLSVTRIN